MGCGSQRLERQTVSREDGAQVHLLLLGNLDNFVHFIFPVSIV